MTGMSIRYLIATASAALFAVVVLAYGYDRAHADRVAVGISVGGHDIGGMSRADAKRKLNAVLAAPVQRPVVVGYGRAKRTLTADDAGVAVDVNGMVNDAVVRSHHGIFLTRAVRDLAGIKVNEQIGTKITYSSAAVKKFVSRTRKRIDRPTINARVRFSASGVGEISGQVGLKAKSRQMRQDIAAAFTNPNARHNVKVRVRRLQPDVRRADLARRYPTVITVDRARFRLHLYKRLKQVKTYRIAVGQSGLETPTGLYTINDRQMNPAWHVPDSAWAGDLAGNTIPYGDPGNPIKARWLGIMNGVGIHGTGDPGSIGSAASHGCIRMLIPDVEALYDRVPINTPVYIG